MTKAQRRRYQREYMRRYYALNQASLGLSQRGRPAKIALKGQKEKVNA